MNHLFKRSLSLIVAVVMVLAMIPASPVHVHAAVDEETYVGYAVNTTSGKGVGRGIKLGDVSGARLNSTYKAYEMTAGGSVEIQIDANTTEGAAFLDDFDGKATVEIAFAKNYGKPTFEYHTGDGQLKTATAVGQETVDSNIVAYVYELDNAVFTGEEAVSFKVSFASNAYFRSIKVLKGVNEPKFVTNATEYKKDYRNGINPGKIEIHNPGAQKQLLIQADVTHNNTLKTQKASIGRATVNNNAAYTITEQFLLEKLLQVYGPGAYEITIRAYWNKEDDAHKVEQTYTFSWCPCDDDKEATREEIVTGATCGAVGSKKVTTYCSVCNTEIKTETVDIPATGVHTEATREEIVTGATCGAAGSKKVTTYCSVCNTEIKTETVDIPATGAHNWADATFDAPKTCKNCGATEGAALIAVAEVNGEKFETLAAAIEAAKDGGTVVLLNDIVLESGIVINSGWNVTIDLAGFDITMTSGDVTTTTQLICNKGTLTITDSDEVDGEICLTYTGARNNDVSISTIRNEGVLNIQGGTINCVNGNQNISYAIDAFNFGTTGEVNISGGTVTGGAGGYCIRMFLSGVNNANTLNVSGGQVGYVWAQQTDAHANMAVINITGGNVNYVYVNTASGDCDVSNVTLNVNAECTPYAPYIGGNGSYILENVNGVYQVVAKPTQVTVATLAELQAALEDNSNNLPIVITEQIVIPAGEPVTLDLNGKTVNSVFDGDSITKHIYALKNYGTLTITDTSAEKNGSINSRGIYNYGSLTLEAGAINAIDGNGGYAVNNQSGSTFIMNGGIVAATYEDDYQSSSGGYDATALKVPAGATATLNGGKIINVCDFTFGVEASGTLNIPADSTIEIIGTHGAIAVQGGKTTINAGKFSIPVDEYSRTDNVLYVSGGELEINGGEFIGDYDTGSGGSCVCDTKGTATINGGTFKGSSGGDVWGTTGTTIKGGTFENLIETGHIAPGYELGTDGKVVASKTYVAQIGTQGYETFAEAWTAAEAGDTIELLAPIVVEAGETLNLDKNVTVSYTSNVEKEAMITNNGTLIVDGAHLVYNYTGAGDPNFGWGSYTIANNATLTVNNGTIEFVGNQTFGTHCSMAIFQYSGSTTINGGNIINNAYRSVRLWHGEMTITGGKFEGQVWVQAVANDSKLTINGGEFAPATRGDASSVFVTNDQYTVEFAVTDGTFTTKIGASEPANLEGAITGGTFTEAAKNGTNEALLGDLVFIKDASGNYGVGEYVAPVAKVGNTEYTSIDEAIAAWTNGTTLTLLSDVTLTDVIKIKTADNRVLNLGTYTMTAADGKNAIEIVAIGAGDSEQTTITINADATNPGGINAGSKSVIYYKYADAGITANDRPLIVINGGVFTGSTSSWGTAGIYTIGTAARKCATLNISGGTFNCSINGSGKSKLIITGGTFNYSVGSQGDSTCYRLISGGTFKTIGFMTADANNTKFWFGTSMGNSNVGVHIDDNGYLVVGGPVITEAGDKFEASSTNYGGWSSYLQYSSAKEKGLYYTSAKEALADNNNANGSVTVYVDELDMTGISYKGTIVADGLTKITNAPDGLKVVNENGDQYSIAEDGTLYIPVAKIGEEKYETLSQAVEAVADGGTITLIANETFTEANRAYNSGSWYDGLYYVGDKSFTIDLGGFTIGQDGAVNDYLLNFKNDGTKANTITIKNGTVDAGNTAFCAICTSSGSTQQITINLENVNIINNNSNGSTIKVRGGAVLNVNAGTVITGENSYLGIECVASTVNIYDGAKIYMNGTSSYNGCLVGACGNGTVNVYGGYGKGVKGGFIAMTSGGTINISGGEWIANTDGTIGNNSNVYVLTAQNNKNENGHAGASIINVTGGTFRGGMDAWILSDATVEKAELNISGGNFNANPTAYLEAGYVAKATNGVYTVAKAVAQIGNTYYATLQEAFKAATEGCTIEILADVVIDSKWDCRDYATGGSHSQFKESVTINGNDHTIKFTGTVSDNNWNTIFRFEENATVKNLTVDISAATGAQRVISAKKSLTVDGLTIIGSAKYGIIFGEGASATDLAAAEIEIKNSTLTGTRRAISDNEGGKDVKSVVITGNTLNTNVYVSASESIVFNNNTANGEVDLRSYAAENVLSVEAQGNTLTGAKNYIYAKTIDAQAEFTTKNPPVKVSNKAELDAALAAAKDGDTIVLTADIDYGTDQLKLEKAITLDLGGNTLTTRNAYGGISVKNNATVKNGTIVHASNTAAIKVWNATAFEDLVIDVQGKGDAGKTIGGIVLQSGSTTKVGSIKNVTIKGAALTNGIETYNCGDAAENVIGSMENVSIDAVGTAMLISAPVGTATNCTFDGGVKGIELWIKGTYSASLTLVNSKVEGGVYAHDEFSSNPSVVNNGTLSLTVDEATTGVEVEDITLTLARAENVTGAELEYIMTNAQAKVGDTYYLTLTDAVAAAKAGDTITLLKDVELAATLTIAKSITIDGNGKTITQAEACQNTYALLYFDGTDVLDITVKNVTFDGIKGGAVIRTLGANTTIDNVVFQNCEHTQVQGLVRLTQGKAVVKNSKFLNNNCTMGISFNYDTNGLDGDTLLVENCVFEDNTANATALVYYVKGAGCEIKNNKFTENKVNCNGNGAVIYLGFQDNCTVTGNLFKDNVVTDSSTSTRVAGAIFAGYQATITGNAFAGNTASNANGDTLGQICISTYYDDGLVNLSENYWNNGAPAYGKDYTIQHQTGAGSYNLSSYYTAYELNANGELVLSGKNEMTFAAKIGTKKYETIAAAIKAANAGEIVTILAGDYTTDVSVNKAITVQGETDANGNNLVNITGRVSVSSGATVKNLNVHNEKTGTYDCALSVNGENIVIDGVKLTGYNGMRYCYAKGDITIKNSTIAASYFAYHFDGSAGGKLVIDNCDITGWVSYAGTIEKVTLQNSTFDQGSYAGQRSYTKNLVIDGCTFKAGYMLDIATTGAAITVSDSKMSDGSSIVELFNKEDIVSSDVTIDGEKITYVAKIGNTYYATLEDALANVADWTTIKLVADATLDYNAREAYGRASTTDIIIDGQGFTLTLNQKDSDWSSIGMANADGKLTLKNMTIEKTGYGDTTGAWNTHAINFTCNVEMKDVTVNNAIAVENGATLNNVTINEANGYYGLWISGNGQTVTVNGGAINATNGGRGIKIADEYVDAPASVTLNVTDTKFNTAKKAAVLVTSTAGANITASNVDITNVAADKVNFVWVDEDRAAYNSKVTVSGCTKAQENVEIFVAQIGENYFKTLAEALTAAKDGDTINLIWAAGDAPIAMNGTVFGKTVTITGTATVDWSKGFLFIGRGGEGDGTVIFDNANLTSASNSNSYGIHVSGREKNTTNKYDGTLVINNSTIELDYLINKGTMTLDNSTLTVKNGFSIGGRPASETETGVDATATISLTNGSKVVVNNHNGMGLGYEAIGVMNIDKTSTFETTQSFLVTAKGTMNIAGKAIIAGTLTNNGSIVLTDAAATLTSSECGNVTTNVADYKAVYENGQYKAIAKVYVVQINDGAKYETLSEAIAAAKAGDTITLIADVTENVTVNKSVTIDGANFKYTGTMTVNNNLTVTVKNVNFVNGGITKTTKGSQGIYTIKNCTFEDNGTYYYALCFKGANKVTIEDCTVKGYMYSFLYVTSSTNSVSVKNVTVENCPSYAVYFASGVNSASFENLTVKNSNNGFVINNTANRAFSIKDCKMENVTNAINHANGTNTITCTATGTNDFGTAAMSEYAKVVLTADATLTAVEGLNVTTNVERSVAKREDGTYKVVAAQAKIGDTYYATLAEAFAAANAGETVTILAGNYTTTLEVKKAIIVEGETDAEGNNLVNITGKLNITADGATVKNINVNNGSNSAGYINAKDVLVEGCTIVGGNGFRNCYTKGTVTFRNSTITGNTYGIHFDGSAGGNIVIEGCTITGWTSFASTIEKVTISDSEFAKGNYNQLRFYQNADMDNVKFNPDMTVDFCEDGVEATFDGCSVTDGSSLLDVIKLSDIINRDVKVTVDGQLITLVAKIGNNYYISLTEAIAAAKAGDTITLIADVTENVTVNKSVTIDGADKTYTGTMTVNTSLTVTVQNVKFVKGCITEAKGTGGNLTVMNCDFNGVDKTIAYAVTMRGGSSVTVVGGTVKGYDYGFLYVPSAVTNVTVKNVTVEGMGYGVHVAYGSKINLENVKMDGTLYGIMTQNYGAKTITLKDCSINATNGIYVWERNTTVSDTFVFEGVNEITGMTTSKQAVLKAATIDGTNLYGDLVSMVNKAEDGQTVKLLSNVTLDASKIVNEENYKYETLMVVDGKNITIDFAGHTATVANYADASQYSQGIKTCLETVIFVYSDAGLTLTDSVGNGGITVPANEDVSIYSMFYNCGGKLTIENGAYTIEKGHAAASIIYSEDAHTTTVNGGSFTMGNATNDGEKPWIFNTESKNESFIYVYGGTYNQDPLMNYGSAKDCEVLIPNTLAVEESNGTWTIVDAKACVGTVNDYNEGFLTLAEAVEFAQAGETVTLLADNAENVELAKTIALDVNGFAYTGKVTLTDVAAKLTAPAGLTVDTTVTTHFVDYKDGAYVLLLTVAQNVQTGEAYATVEKALEEAVSGQTVQLMADTEEVYVIIDNDVTLDLNGNALTAKGVVAFEGSSIVDSSDANTGLLKIAKNKLVLNADNKHLPIYDAENGGYRFFKIIKVASGSKDKDGKFAFAFKAYFDTDAHELLKKGYASTGVKIAVRVSWTTAQGVRTQDFCYSDEQIARYVDGYNSETGKYTYAFELTINNSANYQNLAYYGCIVSDTGVELTK